MRSVTFTRSGQQRAGIGARDHRDGVDWPDRHGGRSGAVHRRWASCARRFRLHLSRPAQGQRRAGQRTVRLRLQALRRVGRRRAGGRHHHAGKRRRGGRPVHHQTRLWRGRVWRRRALAGHRRAARRQHRRGDGAHAAPGTDARAVRQALPNVYTDEGANFVGVGRNFRISGNEVFGVRYTGGANQYGGMYVETSDAAGWPFLRLRHQRIVPRLDLLRWHDRRLAPVQCRHPLVASPTKAACASAPPPITAW